MSLIDDIMAAFSVGDTTGLTAGQLQALNTSSVGAMLSLAGDSLSAAGSLQRGFEAKGSADFQAAQLRQNAGQVQAAAQRDAFQADRQGRMIASRALAVAAASGGGASDPTVVNLIAADAQEASYRKAVALYQGDDQARAMRTAAAAKDYEGKTALVGSAVSAGAGVIRGAGNLASGMARGASLYQRFAGGGPDVSLGGGGGIT